MGKDVEKATQRAAEAALMQVVGSFIDSDTRIEKRKEIRDGIRTRVKSVRSKISEYSQGSIQRLDILDVERDGGLIQVTAKVTVRIEDFKRFIKKVVLAKKKVPRGLLGKVKVQRKQQENLSNLLIDRVVRPVADLSVFTPKLVGELKVIENLDIIRWFRPKPNEHVIAYSVEIKMNPDFLANATRVLQETAQFKFEDNDLSREKYSRLMKRKNSSASIVVGSRYGMPKRLGGMESAWPKETLPEAPIYYFYPKRHIHLCGNLKKITDPKSWDKRSTKTPTVRPTLKVRFLDTEGKLVRQEFLRPQGWDSYTVSVPQATVDVLQTRVVSRLGHVPLNNSRQPICTHKDDRRCRGDLLTLLWSTYWKYNQACQLRIFKSTTFSIFTKATEDVLSRTDEIELSLNQSSP